MTPQGGKIACTHPGKLGDALYALPTIRELSRRHGRKIDFYTSAYCEPLRRLFEAQSCIDRFIVAPGYVLHDFSCGGQPWFMPVPDEYDIVYHLGFQGVPHQSLPDHISTGAGLPTGLPISYEFDLPRPDIDEPYIVSAPRAGLPFREVADRSPVRIVEIGGAGEGTGSPRAIDKTGLDMLDTLSWLAHARGFVGYHSAMLVLANGFPIPKVVWTPPNAFWLLLHAVKSCYASYPTAPSAIEMLHELGVTMPASFCKSLNPADYAEIHETYHARTIKGIVGTFGGREEHEHRSWEYGICLRALRDNGARRILDVGGGGSAFAPAAAWPDVGMDVTVVDPEAYGPWIAEQSRKIGRAIGFVQQDFMTYDGPKDFDGVTCISVLEHIHDDVAFFKKLASHVRVGGILAMTVDFWPDGERKVEPHLRTYNKERLTGLLQAVEGFETIGSFDYDYAQPHVYSYNFASFMLKRVA